MRAGLVVAVILLAGCSSTPPQGLDDVEPVPPTVEELLEGLEPGDWHGIHMADPGQGAAVAIQWNHSARPLEVKFFSEPTGIFIGWFGLVDERWQYAGGTVWREDTDMRQHPVFFTARPGALAQAYRIMAPAGETAFIIEGGRADTTISGPQVDAEQWAIVIGAIEDGPFSMALRASEQSPNPPLDPITAPVVESAPVVSGQSVPFDLGILHIENLFGTNSISNQGLQLASTTPKEVGLVNARTVSSSQSEGWNLLAVEMDVAYATGRIVMSGQSGGQSVATESTYAVLDQEREWVFAGQGTTDWNIETTDAGGWLLEEQHVINVFVGDMERLLGAPGGSMQAAS